MSDMDASQSSPGSLGIDVLDIFDLVGRTVFTVAVDEQIATDCSWIVVANGVRHGPVQLNREHPRNQKNRGVVAYATEDLPEGLSLGTAASVRLERAE